MVKLPDVAMVVPELLQRTAQSGPPVDLRKIAALWPGLQISLEDLERPGYLIDLGVQGGEILVRERDRLPRRRYTVAHELGHWMLNRSNGAGQDLKAKSLHTSIEKWCDQFAAELLMPKAWVLQDLRSGQPEEFLTRVVMAPRRFRVSHQAFRLRVCELTPASLVEVAVQSAAIRLTRHYLAGSLPEALLQRCMENARPFLTNGNGNGCHLDTGTQSLVFRRMLSRNGQCRHWLICVMPRNKRKIPGEAREKDTKAFAKFR